MTKVQLNQPVPDFEIESTGNQTFRLSDNLGKNIVIYFYPKDSTPGCTLEGQQFRDNISEFEQLNTLVVGVSRDSLRKHENFKEKQQFSFELLSDEDEQLCTLFDVLHLKKNYGREYMGIVRSTFLINAEGILVKEWRNVKVKDHIIEVLTSLKEL